MHELTIESNIVYHGKILNLKVDTVELPNGKQTTREVVAHPGAVAVAALNENDEMLLVRQYRYPAGEVLLEIPAGKLEAGESPLECARRELAEETGFNAREWRQLSVFYTTPGFSDEIMYLFLARDLVPEQKTPDDDEFIEMQRVGIYTAVDMVTAGQIKDAKTIAGILMAEKNISR